MAQQSIPDLQQIVSLSPTAYVWINQGGTDYRATTQQVASVNPIANTIVSSLAAPSGALIGARAIVTDATLAIYSVGAAVTGGGSHVIPVFCNGTAWVAG